MELLRRLCDAPGVSGYEDAVRDILTGEVGGHAQEVKVDHLGNLYMSKGLDKKGPHVMFAAHMDEVGLVAEGVDDDGFIKIMPAGGIDPRVLPGKRVKAGPCGIPGVIGCKPLHLETKDEIKKVTSFSGLRVDIGASSRQQVERFIEPGTPFSFDTVFEELNPVLKGKAFDDRAGCYILAELIESDFDFPCTFVWTVQEEVGLRGGYVAAFRVKPDILLVLEGTGACDVPTDRDVARNPFLGKGPVLTVLDSRMACEENLLGLVIDTASREGIGWQYKRPLIGGTDAGAAVRVRPVSAAVIAIPARYIHSPVALAHREDIINTVNLLRAVAGRLKEVKL